MGMTALANSRPRTVIAAFWLFVGSFVVSVLAAIFSVAAVNSTEGRAKIRETAEKTIAELPADQRAAASAQRLTDAAIQLVIIFAFLAVFIILIVALLSGLLALSGKKAARIIAPIFAVLGVPALLFAFDWLTLLSYLLFLLATIFLWLQQSTEYFSRVKEAKIMSQQYPSEK